MELIEISYHNPILFLKELDYDDVSKIASYSGFPVRYPHWKFGMEFEELKRNDEDKERTKEVFAEMKQMIYKEKKI